MESLILAQDEQLAAGLIHASRGAARVAILGGDRQNGVRNTYATFPKLVNSLPKGRLIHRNLKRWHHFFNIAPAVLDGRATD